MCKSSRLSRVYSHACESLLRVDTLVAREELLTFMLQTPRPKNLTRRDFLNRTYSDTTQQQPPGCVSRSGPCNYQRRGGKPQSTIPPDAGRFLCPRTGCKSVTIATAGQRASEQRLSALLSCTPCRSRHLSCRPKPRLARWQ